MRNVYNRTEGFRRTVGIMEAQLIAPPSPETRTTSQQYCAARLKMISQLVLHHAKSSSIADEIKIYSCLQTESVQV